MKKREIGLVLVFILFFACFFISNALAQQELEVSSLLLKVAVHKGDLITKPIVITSRTGGEFALEIIGLPDGAVKLDKTSFSLGEGESTSINAEFDSADIEAGVHAGSIKISDAKKTSYLPVIFEVKSKDVFFDINLDVPPLYSEIAPGGKLVAQVKVFDLTSGGTSDGLGTSNVNLEYKVYSINGNVISSENENIVVQRTAEITKAISFPKDIKEGDYVFAVAAKYGSSVGTSSHLFRIRKAESSLFSEGTDWKFFAVLGIILIFFFGLIYLFISIMKDRDKMFYELKKYNSWELNRQKELLKAQAEFVCKKGVSRKKVRREIKHKIKELRKKHKKRLEEFAKLKKEGNVEEMEKKLKEWKEKGYNTTGIEYKMNNLSTSDMKKLMKKWGKMYKSEGYKNEK